MVQRAFTLLMTLHEMSAIRDDEIFIHAEATYKKAMHLLRHQSICTYVIEADDRHPIA